MKAATDTQRSSPNSRSMEETEVLLREVGIREGQTVLDFGCGQGTYTIPAARIVGDDGIVYALDQDKHKIDDLRAKPKSAGLENIQIVPAVGRAHIELLDESIDVIVLYDVLHSWYHPQPRQRKQILRELHRVLHPRGLLSFYPGDPEVFHHRTELAVIQEEIRGTGFCLQSKCAEMLTHEGSVVRGHIFGFAKSGKPHHA